MNAPEDQNGLREALARYLHDEVNGVGGWQSLTDKARDNWRFSAGRLIAGPLASLIAERDTLKGHCDELQGLIVTAEICAERAIARARAAEAEITRLKEGMEAAPTEAEFEAAEEAVMAEWAVMREQLRAPHINWPVSPTNWRILRAGWTAIAKARATISQEHPHG